MRTIARPPVPTEESFTSEQRHEWLTARIGTWLGIAAVPPLLFKLWSVYPELFATVPSGKGALPVDRLRRPRTRSSAG